MFNTEDLKFQHSFRNIAEGGITTEVDGEEVKTGIIISLPIRLMITRFGINNFLSRLEDYQIKPERLKYIKHLAKYQSIDIEFKDSDPFTKDFLSANILHANNFRRLNLSEPSNVMVVNNLFSYGIPAAYSSNIQIDSVGTKLFASECTEDIYFERQKQGLSYSKGVVLKWNYHGEFIPYIDRKTESYYLSLFVKKVLYSKDFIDTLNLNLLENNAKQLESDLKELVKSIKEKPLQEDLEVLEVFQQKHHFSVVGYCLFEIIHEFLRKNGLTINQANGILQAIDPKQKQLWSMRSFTLCDTSTLKRIFSNTEKFYSNLIKYVNGEFVARLEAFWDYETKKIYNICFLTEYSRLLNQIEIEEKNINIYKTCMPGKLNIPQQLESVVKYVDAETVEVRRKLSKDEFSLLQEANEDNLMPFLFFKDRLLLKLSYLHVCSEVTAQTSKLLRDRDITYFAIPFQHDTRGEFLLLSNISSYNIQTQNVKILPNERGKVELIPIPNMSTVLSVKQNQFFDFDNTLYKSNNILRSINGETFIKRTRLEIELLNFDLKTSLIDSLGQNLQHLKYKNTKIVALPFYRTQNIVEIVNSLSKSFNQTNVIFLLTSDLPSTQFEHEIEEINSRVMINKSKDLLFFLSTYTNQKQNNIVHLNKYVTGLLACDVVEYLKHNDYDVSGILFTEADVNNAKDYFTWVSKYSQDNKKVMIPSYNQSFILNSDKDSFVFSYNILHKTILDPIFKSNNINQSPDVFGGIFYVGSKLINLWKESIEKSFSLGNIFESSLLGLLKHWETVDVASRLVLPSTDFREKYYAWLKSFLDNVSEFDTTYYPDILRDQFNSIDFHKELSNVEYRRIFKKDALRELRENLAIYDQFIMNLPGLSQSVKKAFKSKQYDYKEKYTSLLIYLVSSRHLFEKNDFSEAVNVLKIYFELMIAS